MDVAGGKAAAPSEAPPRPRWILEDAKGKEIHEKILKPMVYLFDKEMKNLHNTRIPDVGREEEEAFLQKAVQHIRKYILMERNTMKVMTQVPVLTGMMRALLDGSLDAAGDKGRKTSFVASLILSTTPFINVIEKSDVLMELLFIEYKAEPQHGDDCLVHHVSRIYNSLLESKHSEAGVHAFVERNKVVVVPKFMSGVSNDALLFIFLELIGASEVDQRLDMLDTLCFEFDIMHTLLMRLAHSASEPEIKNLIEAVVTISSNYSGRPRELSQLVRDEAVAMLLAKITSGRCSANATVCRLAALTHLMILEAECVTEVVSRTLPEVRSLLLVTQTSLCENRDHQIYTAPVGSVRIATVELLVAYIDKMSPDNAKWSVSCEDQISGSGRLIEQIMCFWLSHTKNDFIGIEMVQLVKRVIESNVQPRINAMFSDVVLDDLAIALAGIANIWELGHMRCLVSDALAQLGTSQTTAARLAAYPKWAALRPVMEDVRDGKVTNPRKRARRQSAPIENPVEFLAIIPGSPLAAGDIHKTFDESGVLVHEDTPRKVVFLQASKEDTPRKEGGADAADGTTARTLF